MLAYLVMIDDQHREHCYGFKEWMKPCNANMAGRSNILLVLHKKWQIMFSRNILTINLYMYNFHYNLRPRTTDDSRHGTNLYVKHFFLTVYTVFTSQAERKLSMLPLHDHDVSNSLRWTVKIIKSHCLLRSVACE